MAVVVDLWGVEAEVGSPQLASLRELYGERLSPVEVLTLGRRTLDAVRASEVARTGEALTGELDGAVTNAKGDDGKARALVFAAARIVARGMASDRSVREVTARVRQGLDGDALPEIKRESIVEALEAKWGKGIAGLALLAWEGLKYSNQVCVLGIRLWFRCQRFPKPVLAKYAALKGKVEVVPGFVEFYGDPDAAVVSLAGLAAPRIGEEVDILFVLESALLATGNLEDSTKGYEREIMFPPFTPFEVVGVQGGVPYLGEEGRPVVFLRETLGVAGPGQATQVQSQVALLEAR